MTWSGTLQISLRILTNFSLVHILLKSNKQELLKEIQDIYEVCLTRLQLFQFLQDNPNVESFVDWVWDLYAEKENQGHEETKSDYSDATDKKAQAFTSKGLCTVYSCHSDRSTKPTGKTFSRCNQQFIHSYDKKI